jgi:ribonuclease T1
MVDPKGRAALRPRPPLPGWSPAVHRLVVINGNDHGTIPRSWRSRVHTRHQHWTHRLLAALAIVASVLGVTTAVAPAADAAVHSSCTQSRCAAARSADSTWSSKGYPSSRGWYDWPDGRCNFTGGTFQNREGRLPADHRYQEFDVYPRACDTSRDAYRIVVDRTNGSVYFSPDHYANFYRL